MSGDLGGHSKPLADSKANILGPNCPSRYFSTFFVRWTLVLSCCQYIQSRVQPAILLDPGLQWTWAPCWYSAPPIVLYSLSPQVSQDLCPPPGRTSTDAWSFLVCHPHPPLGLVVLLQYLLTFCEWTTSSMVKVASSLKAVFIMFISKEEKHTLIYF